MKKLLSFVTAVVMLLPMFAIAVPTAAADTTVATVAVALDLSLDSVYNNDIDGDNNMSTITSNDGSITITTTGADKVYFKSPVSKVHSVTCEFSGSGLYEFANYNSSGKFGAVTSPASPCTINVESPYDTVKVRFNIDSATTLTINSVVFNTEYSDIAAAVAAAKANGGTVTLNVNTDISGVAADVISSGVKLNRGDSGTTEPAGYAWDANGYLVASTGTTDPDPTPDPEPSTEVAIDLTISGCYDKSNGTYGYSGGVGTYELTTNGGSGAVVFEIPLKFQGSTRAEVKFRSYTDASVSIFGFNGNGYWGAAQQKYAEESASSNTVELKFNAFDKIEYLQIWSKGCEIESIKFYKPAVAEVGGKNYGSIDEAIAAAGQGGAVVLLSDSVVLTSAHAESGVTIKKGGTSVAAPEGYEWTDGILTEVEPVLPTVAEATVKVDLSDGSNILDDAGTTVTTNADGVTTITTTAWSNVFIKSPVAKASLVTLDIESGYFTFKPIYDTSEGETIENPSSVTIDSSKTLIKFRLGLMENATHTIKSIKFTVPGFTSVADAITAAGQGGTVTLTADTTVTVENAQVAATNGVTINKGTTTNTAAPEGYEWTDGILTEKEIVLPPVASATVNATNLSTPNSINKTGWSIATEGASTVFTPPTNPEWTEFNYSSPAKYATSATIEFADAAWVEFRVNYADGTKEEYQQWYSTHTLTLDSSKEIASFSILAQVAVKVKSISFNAVFTSVADAVNATNSGDTVTLTANTSFTAEVAAAAFTKGVTINNGGTATEAPENYKWNAEGNLVEDLPVVAEATVNETNISSPDSTSKTGWTITTEGASTVFTPPTTPVWTEFNYSSPAKYATSATIEFVDAAWVEFGVYYADGTYVSYQEQYSTHTLTLDSSKEIASFSIKTQVAVKVKSIMFSATGYTSIDKAIAAACNNGTVTLSANGLTVTGDHIAAADVKGVKINRGTTDNTAPKNYKWDSQGNLVKSVDAIMDIDLSDPAWVTNATYDYSNGVATVTGTGADLAFAIPSFLQGSTEIQVEFETAGTTVYVKNEGTVLTNSGWISNPGTYSIDVSVNDYTNNMNLLTFYVNGTVKIKKITFVKPMASNELELRDTNGYYNVAAAALPQNKIGSESAKTRYQSPTNSNRYVVYLYAGIDSLDYKEVGFLVTVDGVTRKLTTTSAYDSIVVNNQDPIYPSAFNTPGYECKYIFVSAVNFSMDMAKNSTLVYQPYAVKYNEDGSTTTIYGEKKGWGIHKDSTVQPEISLYDSYFPVGENNYYIPEGTYPVSTEAFNRILNANCKGDGAIKYFDWQRANYTTGDTDIFDGVLPVGKMNDELFVSMCAPSEGVGYYAETNGIMNGDTYVNVQSHHKMVKPIGAVYLATEFESLPGDTTLTIKIGKLHMAVNDGGTWSTVYNDYLEKGNNLMYPLPWQLENNGPTRRNVESISESGNYTTITLKVSEFLHNRGTTWQPVIDNVSVSMDQYGQVLHFWGDKNYTFKNGGSNIKGIACAYTIQLVAVNGSTENLEAYNGALLADIGADLRDSTYEASASVDQAFGTKTYAVTTQEKWVIGHNVTQNNYNDVVTDYADVLSKLGIN